MKYILISEIINDLSIEELKEFEKELPEIKKAIKSQIEFLKEMKE